MAPVIIAVDSFGPVTDNAQSVYELSRIESHPDVSAEIEKHSNSNPILPTPSTSWKTTARETPLKPQLNPS